MKQDDAGQRSVRGRLPKSSTQDPLAGGIAALLRPGYAGVERELHARCEVFCAGAWLSTHF
jgi:hypothetical protein